MLPMIQFSPPAAVVSAFARVDKATSEFLNCPDWRINMGICDIINSKHWLAKDFVRALRGRLQHKNPNVQLLALTLLETLVKNCGDHIHVQISERKILPEMIKIVKKKIHMRVREKILVLIDTWQEAFGGRGGKPSQYYLAYEELKRYGVEFSRRSPNTAPVITPPVTLPSSGHPQAGVSSSTRHEAMASWTENLSFSIVESMRNVSDLLSDMLQAVDPKDRAAVKDDVIIDLADKCRSNQKKLVQMLALTINEELLRQGLQLNDTLQYVLEKHDAIASGSPIPVQAPSSMIHPPDAHRSRLKHINSKEVNLKSSVVASAPVVPSSMNEAEEEQNDSAPPIARRHYKTQTAASQNCSGVTASKNDEKAALDPSLAMAIVLSDPLPPANSKSAEDMIDFLSLALSPAKASTSNIDQTPPVSTAAENQTQVPLNSYVVPWAQAQPQPELKIQPQVQTTQQQSTYIPPPWAPTPGYYCNPYASTYLAATAGSYYNNSPSQQVPMTGADGWMNVNPTGAGLKPFIPSYRLFEDLNVLGNLRASSTPGTSGPSMLSGKK